jgi:hypothetical protein
MEQDQEQPDYDDARGYVVPGCTVRYDPLTGHGVNVTRLPGDVFQRVELEFVNDDWRETVYTLTVAQADQLRAALDALIRVPVPIPDLADVRRFADAMASESGPAAAA